MAYLPFYVGGVLIAAVVIAHWYLVRRLLAVSSRFSYLVDRLRLPREQIEDQEADFDPEELERLLMQATLEQFGPQDPDSANAEDGESGESEDAAREDGERSTPSSSLPTLRAPQGLAAHLLFFGGLMLGGAIMANIGGYFLDAQLIRGELFAETFGQGPWPPFILVFGGILIGVGTRMAGGCASGHGLCGVSRLQPGSLVATACFFGAGIVFSLLLRTLQ